MLILFLIKQLRSHPSKRSEEFFSKWISLPVRLRCFTERASVLSLKAVNTIRTVERSLSWCGEKKRKNNNNVSSTSVEVGSAVLLFLKAQVHTVVKDVCFFFLAELWNSAFWLVTRGWLIIYKRSSDSSSGYRSQVYIKTCAFQCAIIISIIVDMAALV